MNNQLSFKEILRLTASDGCGESRESDREDESGLRGAVEGILCTLRGNTYGLTVEDQLEALRMACSCLIDENGCLVGTEDPVCPECGAIGEVGHHDGNFLAPECWYKQCDNGHRWDIG